MFEILYKNSRINHIVCNVEPLEIYHVIDRSFATFFFKNNENGIKTTKRDNPLHLSIK